jgi:hypothetical protein
MKKLISHFFSKAIIPVACIFIGFFLGHATTTSISMGTLANSVIAVCTILTLFISQKMLTRQRKSQLWNNTKDTLLSLSSALHKELSSINEYTHRLESYSSLLNEQRLPCLLSDILASYIPNSTVNTELENTNVILHHVIPQKTKACIDSYKKEKKEIEADLMKGSFYTDEILQRLHSNTQRLNAAISDLIADLSGAKDL